jgi:hypothetical protein
MARGNHAGERFHVHPRQRDGGEVFDFGSVDKTETKEAALNILEGGLWSVIS